MKKQKSAFYNIQGVWVEKAIFSKKFCCDLEKCKGACCWAEIGSEGCEVTPEEKEKIEKLYPGVVTTNVEGDLVVSCDSKEVCKLCTMEEGIGFCRAQSENAKPISCGLYPIIKGNIGSEPTLELSDTWDDFCIGATEKGEELNITVYELCREYIKELYGEYFVDCCDIFYGNL